MKKILIISTWCLLIIGLIVCLGFVNTRQAVQPCKSLDITIQQDEENSFVQPQDVQELIVERGDSVIGQPASTLNVPELENALNSHAAIAKAEVYVTINGEVKVDVIQRKPIVRIIDK
ncbi:MAG: hypothetical protein IT235_02445, partial [Bacteroidia bacterium]|nr:hypothetical protein [Bacteroidia bacterium]